MLQFTSAQVWGSGVPKSIVSNLSERPGRALSRIPREFRTQPSLRFH